MSMSKREAEERVCANLRALVGVQGVSRKDIAHYIGVSPVTVSRWLNGRCPHVGWIVRICGVIGVEPARVFEGVR